MKNQYEEELFTIGKSFKVQQIVGMPSGCLKIAVMMLLVIIAGLYSITYGASNLLQKKEEEELMSQLPITFALKTANDYDTQVFLNPSANYLGIEGEEKSTEYELLNMEGSTTVSENSPESGLTRLQVIDLIPGFYVLLLKASEDWTNKNIAVQYESHPYIETDENILYGSYLSKTY